MKKNSFNMKKIETETHDVSEASQYVHDFIVEHESQAFPLQFFSHKVTNNIFFSPIEKYFSEDEIAAFKNKYDFLGEVLILPLSSKDLTPKVKSIRSAFSISSVQSRQFVQMYSAFNLQKIGTVFNLSLIRPMFISNTSSVTPTEVIGSPVFKKAIQENNILRKFFYIKCMDWMRQNYQTVLS